MDSILDSVKKQLGITPEYTHFDPDIIMHINSVFVILHQLGVGPEEGFSIEDNTMLWEDYLDDNAKLQIIKSYMYLRVRLLFDPPASSTHMECVKQQIAEFEWRMNVAVETGEN